MANKGRLIRFEYISINGTKQPNNCVKYFNPEHISIDGERCKVVFDPDKKRPYRMTGLFIIVDGNEYGSITITLEMFTKILECQCVEDLFRLHVDEFAIEFE